MSPPNENASVFIRRLDGLSENFFKEVNMKKLITAILATVTALTVVGLSGCLSASGMDGKDGKDGQDASAYDFYELARTVPGQENMTVDEFLLKYLNYTSVELETELSSQSNANRSVLSCVSILTSFTYEIPANRKSYHQIFTGAGVIVDLDKAEGDAYVLTNCHVVYNDASKDEIASGVYLYLYGQDAPGVNYNIYYEEVYRTFAATYYDYTIDDDKDYRIEAEVVAASQTYDLALLKISDSEVLRNSAAIAAEFSESDDVYVKESVYAIGNPEGEGMSVTSGTVTKESQNIMLNLSDKHANDENYFTEYRVIGTDTAINGGNSGGGMFGSLDGKLIGIVNSKHVAEDVDNMGYVLPASYARRLWLAIRDGYEGGYITDKQGVKVAKFPADCIIKSTSAYWDNASRRTILEEKVAIETDAGDFKKNDLITNIKISDKSGNVVENKAVTRSYHVSDTMISAREGYTVEVSLLRGSEPVTVTFTATLSDVK